MNEQHTKSNPKISIPRPLLLTGAMLLTVLVCVLLFHFFYEPVVTDTPVFFDFIIEATAESGYNKAGELWLFRLLTLAGFLLLTIFVLIINRKTKDPGPDFDIGREDTAYMSYIPLLFLLPACTYLLISGVFSGPLFFMAGYCALLRIWLYGRPASLGASEKYPYPVLCSLPVLSYYSLLSVFTLLTRFSPAFTLSSSGLYMGSVFLTVLSLLLCRYLPAACSVRRITLLLQLPIPLLLTLYLRDTYLYQGRLLRVPFAPGYYLLIYTLLAGCCLSLAFFFKKAGLSHDMFVAKVTPIVIFIYRSYQCCPMFAQPDQHHHGEQMIPWQQIIDLGQKPYSEYTPVSGLFPLVNGFLQNILMEGTVSDYAPALSLTTALFALLTMYLITLHIGSTRALLLAALFSLPAYNRQYMVLPLLLLFYLPSLLHRKGLWLRVWLFSCFLGGLYYPLFGAAVLVGTLPLLLLQIKGYIKAGSLKEDLKKPSFYTGWGLCLIPILLCLPLLARMALHTLTYSSQTVPADGISLAGQHPPDSFLSLFSGFPAFRGSLYLIYRFFLPAFWLWLPFLLLLLCLSGGKNTLKNENTRLHVCSLLSVLLTLAVSYSYTLVRADTNVYLARTAPVLIAVGGLFSAVRLLGPQSPATVKKKASVLLAALCCSLPFLCYAHVGDEKTPALWTYPDGDDTLVADDASKLFTYYTVPDTFVKMSEEDLLSDPSRLGSGFMVADQFSYLRSYDRVLQKMSSIGEADRSYMGYDGQGFYYYLNTRACATGFLPVARSSRAQGRLLEAAINDRPIIFPLDPEKSYYLYRWLMSGEADYVYDRDDNCFYPSEVAALLFTPGSKAPLLTDCLEVYSPDSDLRRICQSFGDSADRLLKERTDSAFLPLDKAGSGPINGYQHDLLYLPLSFDVPGARPAEGKISLSDCSRIEISFKSAAGEKASVSCLAGDGNLLIPLGMNPHWLLNSEHDEITVRWLDAAGRELLSLPVSELSPYLQADKKEAAGFYHIADAL